MHNQGYVEAVPAYGRDYTKQGDVKADWNAGMDFQDALTRQYLNKQDADSMGLKVIVRYARLMKVVAVN
jgi:hypothetical protein